jgi:hypothetical protein
MPSRKDNGRDDWDYDNPPPNRPFRDGYDDNDDDGVILELSNESRRRATERRPLERRPADRRNSERRGSERSRSSEPRYRSDNSRRPSDRRDRRLGKQKTKSRFLYFYIFTLLAGVIVCVVLFAMFFQTMMQNNPVVVGSTARETPAPTPNVTRDIRQTYGMITGLVNEFNNRSVTLLEIGNGRTNTYEVADSTHIRNRFGATLSFSELRIGMIIDVGYDAQNMSAATLSESPQAFEFRFQNNVRVNLENARITLGNDSYDFNSQTMVRYRGDPYPISQITPMDTVTLVGYHNTIWFVQLEGSHGFLRIEQDDKVIDGTLAIDASIFMLLKDAVEPIPLVEGTHRVVVEGQNIEPFIDNVVIRPGETLMLSLIDVVLRSAMLQVTTSEADAVIIINGEALTEPGPAEVTFGEHIIRVEKDGFMPVEQSVTVGRHFEEVFIEMTRIARNATIVIYTYPPQAEIYLNNIFIGYSPLTYETDAGFHSVVARMDGYNEFVFPAWEVNEGPDNYRTFILTAVNPDPFANLPPPENAEPVDQGDGGTG